MKTSARELVKGAGSAQGPDLRSRRASAARSIPWATPSCSQICGKGRGAYENCLEVLGSMYLGVAKSAVFRDPRNLPHFEGSPWGIELYMVFGSL